MNTMIKFFLTLLLLIVNVKTSDLDEPVLCNFDSEEEIAQIIREKVDYLDVKNNKMMSLNRLEDLEDLEALDDTKGNTESSDSEEVVVKVNKLQAKTKGNNVISAKDKDKKQKNHRTEYVIQNVMSTLFADESKEPNSKNSIKEILDYKKEFGTKKWKVRWSGGHNDTWEPISSFITNGKVCLALQEFEAKRNNNKYYGVSWDKGHNKWAAYLWHRKKYHIGYYSMEIEAARAVNNLCRELQIPIKNPLFLEEKTILSKTPLSSKSSDVSWGKEPDDWSAEELEDTEENLESFNSKKVGSFDTNKIYMNLRSKIKNLQSDTSDYNEISAAEKNHPKKFKKIFDSEESEPEIRTQNKQKMQVDGSKNIPRLLNREKKKVDDSKGIDISKIKKKIAYEAYKTYIQDEIDSDTAIINQFTEQIGILEKENAVKREILQKIKTEKKLKLQSCLQKRKTYGGKNQNRELKKTQESLTYKEREGYKIETNIDHESNVNPVAKKTKEVQKLNPGERSDKTRQELDLKRKRSAICEYCNESNREPYLLSSKSSNLKLCDTCYRSEKKHGELIPRDLRRPDNTISTNICEFCKKLNTGKYLLNNKTSEFKICRNCYRSEKKRDLLIPRSKRAKGVIKLVPDITKKFKMHSSLEKRKISGDEKPQVSFAHRKREKKEMSIDHDYDVNQVRNHFKKTQASHGWKQLDETRQAIYLKRKRSAICEYCDQFSCNSFLSASKSTDFKLCDACYRSEKKHGELIPRDIRRADYKISTNICEFCQKLNTGKYLLNNKTSEFKICRNCYRCEKKRDLIVPLNKRVKGIVKLASDSEYKQRDKKINLLVTEDKMKVKTETENKKNKLVKVDAKFIILDK